MASLSDRPEQGRRRYSRRSPASRATSGQIILRGEDVTRLGRSAGGSARLSTRISVSSLTVRETSVRLGQRCRLRRRSRPVWRGAAVRSIVESLSGGERQLVAIARAIAARPGAARRAVERAGPSDEGATRRQLRATYLNEDLPLQVTHDFAEAGVLGDVAIVLDHGQVARRATGRRLPSPGLAVHRRLLGVENVFGGPRARSAPRPRISGCGEGPVRRVTGRVHDRWIDLLRPRGRGARAPHAVIRAEEVSLSVEPSMSSMQNQFRGRIVESSRRAH